LRLAGRSGSSPRTTPSAGAFAGDRFAKACALQMCVHSPVLLLFGKKIADGRIAIAHRSPRDVRDGRCSLAVGVARATSAPRWARLEARWRRFRQEHCWETRRTRAALPPRPLRPGNRDFSSSVAQRAGFAWPRERGAPTRFDPAVMALVPGWST
jgi:hypothetical protein